MEDIQIALSPLVQVMQSSGAKDLPVGRKPFSTHLDAAIDEVAQGLPEVDATVTADDVPAAPDTPEFAFSTDVMASPRGDAALGQMEVGARPSAEPRLRVSDWSTRGGAHASPHSGEVAEIRADDKSWPTDSRVLESDRSSHNMATQKGRQAPLPLRMTTQDGLTDIPPMTAAPRKHGQAEHSTMHETAGPDAARIVPARVLPAPLMRMDASTRPVPDISPPARVDVIGASMEPAGNGKGLDKLPQGEDRTITPVQGTERASLNWSRLPDTTKPYVSPDKRGAGEGKALPDGQVNFEIQKTSVSGPAILPRPGVDSTASGIVMPPRDISDQPGKSGMIPFERESPDAAASVPIVGARGASMPTLSTAPEISRHIAVQLADAMPRAIGREVEISLNPQELGRVRISLSAQDAGLNMTIVAERAETLDLMRRHIDQLAQEFRELGYGDVSFDFGQSGKERPQEDSLAVAEQYASPDEGGAIIEAAASSPRPVATAAGLDLRI